MCQGQDSNRCGALWTHLSMAYLWATRDFPGDLSHNLLNSCDAPSNQPLITTLQQATSKIQSSRILKPLQVTLLSRVSLKSLQAMVSTGSVGNTHPLPLQIDSAGHSLGCHFSLLCHQMSWPPDQLLACRFFSVGPALATEPHSLQSCHAPHQVFPSPKAISSVALTILTRCAFKAVSVSYCCGTN